MFKMSALDTCMQADKTCVTDQLLQLLSASTAHNISTNCCFNSTVWI